MSDVKCKKCVELINESTDIITCWQCKSFYHNMCGKISKSASKVLRQNENFKWLCDVCLSIPLTDLLSEKLNLLLESEASPLKNMKEIVNRLEQLSRNVEYLNTRINSEQAKPSSENGSFSIRPNTKRHRSGSWKIVDTIPEELPPTSSPVNIENHNSLNFDHLNFDISLLTPEQQQRLVEEQQQLPRHHFLYQQQLYQQRQKQLYLEQQQHRQELDHIRFQQPAQNVQYHQTQQLQQIVPPPLQMVIQQQPQPHQMVMQQHEIENRQQQLQNESNNTNVNSNCQIQAAHRTKYKYLYVSQLKPSTTDDQMIQFVADRLNISQSDVTSKILVRKDFNFDELEYVSFKIGLKEDVIEYAMNNNFWPDGVTVRNFQDRRRGPRPERGL